MGSITWGVQAILKIGDVLTPTSLSWGRGHMEHAVELFGIATALQLTSRAVINISRTLNWFHGYVKQLWPCFEPEGWE